MYSDDVGGRTRRQFLAGLGLAAGGLAGCAGPAESVERRAVEVTATGFEVARIEEWVAGTATEYGAAIVVDGTLRNVDEDVRPVPVVSAQFRATDGQRVGTARARYRRDREWTDPDEPFPVAAGESQRFRLTFEAGRSVGYTLSVTAPDAETA